MRFIGYREETYIEEVQRAKIPYDLYRQITTLEWALPMTKDHQEYYHKLALLTRYQEEFFNAAALSCVPLSE